MIALNSECLFKKIGHEFWDKRFLFLRDKTSLSVFDINHYTITTLFEAESEQITLDVDMINKKINVYCSQIVEGEMKLRSTEIR